MKTNWYINNEKTTRGEVKRKLIIESASYYDQDGAMISYLDKYGEAEVEEKLKKMKKGEQVYLYDGSVAYTKKEEN